MIFQIGLLGETTKANVTFKWPGATMHIHVRLKIARSGKRFGAEIALVWLLLYVSHAMIVKIWAGCKTLATHLTLMWLFSRMNSAMSIQRARSAEALATNQTYMRLLAGMRSHVSLQQRWPIKGLAANFTGQQRTFTATRTNRSLRRMINFCACRRHC